MGTWARGRDQHTAEADVAHWDSRYPSPRSPPRSIALGSVYFALESATTTHQSLSPPGMAQLPAPA